MYVGKIISQCEKHFSRFIMVYLKRPSGHFDRCVIFLQYIMSEALLAIHSHTYTRFTQPQTPVVTRYLHGYKHVHCSTQAHAHFQIRNMFWHTCSNEICDVLPFNFFTTVKLAEKLKAKNKSLVGTVNRICREISQSVKQSRKDRYSTTILKITCLHSQFTNASLQKMSLCWVHCIEL